MKRKFARGIAGLLALLMVLVSISSATPVYADNTNQKEAAEQVVYENVLTVTQEMVGENGELLISGEWDRIVVPKEIKAGHISFRDVTADAVEIESGTGCKIEMVSGTVGKVEVVPANVTELSMDDLVRLIRQGKNTQRIIELYQEAQQEKQNYLNTRPTVITKKDMVVNELQVSGNAKLDCGAGQVELIRVEADGVQSALDVGISNYNGAVKVNQTNREDGKWMIARVQLDNSVVENFSVQGEGQGNIVLNGQKSEIKDAKVEKAPMVSLNVQTQKLDFTENSKDAKFTVLTKVEEVQISADNTQMEVAGCATVNSAKVDGNDVNIGGEGLLKSVDITGEGAYVSTFGTKVTGKNNYVRPTVVGKTRDLGGLHIVIGDWFTDESAVPTTPEEIAQQEYREALMEKYNFTIERKKIVDEWYPMLETFTKSVELGAPAAQIFILDQKFVLGNRALCYDLSKLSELDFTDDKWNDTVREVMTYGTGIYGMSDESNESEPRGGIIYNKKLFEAAGLDPDLPYQLQESGEWTWSKFTEICEQLTRDTDGDGAIDVYASASRSEQMLKELLVSTGTWLVDYEDGQYVSNLDDPDVKKALEFATELRDAGYSLDCQTDPDTDGSDWNANYNYHRKLFLEETVAMQFAEAWYLNFSSEYGLYADMEDLGFVCCPKPDGEENYHTYFTDNVAVIPACYDEQTAADIAFAYNLWTSPVPKYGTVEEDWKQIYEENLDEKALDETMALLYKNGTTVNLHCIDEGAANEDFKIDNFFWSWPYDTGNGTDLDTCIENHLSYFASEMEEPLAKANESKRLEVKAPRPDGSESEFLTCPYEVELKDDNTIKITERKDTSATEVVIPETLFRRNVTEIGASVFRNDEITSVTIPETVTRIGEYAFADCWNLTEINIPNSVLAIGDSAFNNCVELESIVIPETVISIGAYAFTDCDKITLTVVRDSYAATYAEENEVPYVYLGEETNE